MSSRGRLLTPSANAIVPLEGSIKPAIMLRIVDFPAAAAADETHETAGGDLEADMLEHRDGRTVVAHEDLADVPQDDRRCGAHRCARTFFSVAIRSSDSAVAVTIVAGVPNSRSIASASRISCPRRTACFPVPSMTRSSVAASASTNVRIDIRTQPVLNADGARRFECFIDRRRHALEEHRTAQLARVRFAGLRADEADRRAEAPVERGEFFGAVAGHEHAHAHPERRKPVPSSQRRQTRRRSARRSPRVLLSASGPAVL